MLWPTGFLPDSKDGSLAINGIGHLSKLRLGNHMITSILRGLWGEKTQTFSIKTNLSANHRNNETEHYKIHVLRPQGQGIVKFFSVLCG